MWTLGWPPVKFRVDRLSEGVLSHPKAQIHHSADLLIGGGGRVRKPDDSTPQNMLTALYPNADGHGIRSWVASSKDHGLTSPAWIDLWVVSAEIDQKSVYVARGANAGNTGVVETWSFLPKEYVLIGGGARAYLEETPYAGTLLIGCAPVFAEEGGSDGWWAAATDHLTTSPVVTEAYAVGISREFLEQHQLEVINERETGAASNYATAEVNLGGRINPDGDDPKGLVVGGGVAPHPGQAKGNNFLTSSWPITTDRGLPIGWRATSQDHYQPSVITLDAWAFAIRERQ